MTLERSKRRDFLSLIFIAKLILCSQKNHEYIYFYKNVEEKAKGEDFCGELQSKRNNISRNT